MLVHIDLVRLHARIDSDYEDTLILHYIEAAQSFAENYIGSKIHPIDKAPEGDESSIVTNPSIQQAMLLHIASMYENREAFTDMKTMPVALGVRELLAPYRVWNI